MKGRVLIEAVSPSVDGGRYAAKAVIGDDVIVGADIFREGHEQLAATVRYRGPDDSKWTEAPLQHDVNDRWFGSFRVDAIGAWRFTINSWTDYYATWLDALRKNATAGKDVTLDLADGAVLLDRRRKKTAIEDRTVIENTVETLQGAAPVQEKVTAAANPELLAALERSPERLDLSTYAPELALWVDRERAQFSAWYEMFPRSEGATETRGGTFAEAAKRLPAVADMGFDVLYLPPIHPIGRTNRKGTEGPHDLHPDPHAPGVPWAIGGGAGGHMSVHPDLGTIDDFDDFVAEAGRHGLEVALDFAIQCSPDHPWVSEHPEWFKHRSDGSIRYAENPPKQYQDIYPIDFDTPDYEGLRNEMKRVVDFWIGHGIRIFRVDNPHTKALPFWKWLIDAIHADHPDVIFLAEAFTRPKMMKALGKLGFTQSYTYFAWRNTKYELEEYLTELSRTDMVDYYRPNFWPNTPDILTEYLQTGGVAAFKIRLVLAALLSPSYGIYSGYELFENTPLHEGSEEYFASEKYNYRPRDYTVDWSLAPYIAKINAIREDHAAFRKLDNLWFHSVTDDNMIAFSKTAQGRTDPVLAIVNLDPHHPRETSTWLDLWQLGLEHAGPYEAYDLITEASYIWHGPSNYVRLDPHWEPAHVLRLRGL